MQKIDEIRRANLLTLIGEAGSAAALASRIGVSPAYISQLKTRSAHSGSGKARSVGDDTARKLEQAFGKPQGWMDNAHPNELGRSTTLGQQSASTPEVGRSEPFVTQRVLLFDLQKVGSLGEPWWMYDPRHVSDTVTCPVQSGPRTFALTVDGESMYQPGNPDSIPPGVFVFVDPDREPRHHNVVVARERETGGAMLRRLVVDGTRRYLEATNPAWPKRIVEVDNGIELLGVVVYMGRRLI